MSNPTTQFLTGGIDLSSIFQPLSFGTAYSTATGYKIPNGQDLNQIFAAYVNGTKANTTGFQVNSNDLCNIFAKYEPMPFIITGLYYSYSEENGYGSLYINSGIGTINFVKSVSNVSIYIVAGGGGGGGGVGSYQFQKEPQRGGGGGGAGSIASLTNIPNFAVGETFNLTIGDGGSVGAGQNGNANGKLSGVTGGGSGSSTIFSGSSFKITTNGGHGGGGGVGGTGGNNTSSGGLEGDVPTYTGTIPYTYKTYQPTGKGGDENVSGTTSNINGNYYIVDLNNKQVNLGGGGGGGQRAGGSGYGGNGQGGSVGNSSEFERKGIAIGSGGGGGTGSSGGLNGGTGHNGSVIFFFKL